MFQIEEIIVLLNFLRKDDILIMIKGWYVTL